MRRRGKITILIVSFMLLLLPMTSFAAKPIKLFIAGTSGAEDTQSMGHFEFAKRLAAASDGVFKAEVKINAVMGETDDVTEQAIILSEAARMELVPATNSLAISMNQFNAQAKEAPRFINAIAAGSKVGAGNVLYIAEEIGRAHV